MDTLKKKSTIVDQNLKVCVRIRPMSRSELRQNATKTCFRIDDKLISLIDPTEEGDFGLRLKRSRNREYTFDYAFDESCTQQDVFRHTTLGLIEHVANGYNATVFASGATGAGKTHTMVGTEVDSGIMVRALDELFHYMAETSTEYSYRVSMAYMELYNEVLRDLLYPGPEFLDLREDTKGVQVAGLHEVELTSRNGVFALLQKGNNNRTTEPTAANRTSSRSHAILQITVRQSTRIPSIHEEIKVGKLFLIDLAGSERASKTMNRGRRMTEGAHINRSLLALGNCINALADPNTKRYVNYRDSKLTRLLKDALAGNCRTVMIAHISPSSWQFEETCNTLAYADRAKSLRTKVRRNVIDVTHHVSQYAQLIEDLQEEIALLKTNLANKCVDGEDDSNSAQLHRMKEDLLAVCSEQLGLRGELVRLRSQLVEINLEESRQSLLAASCFSSKTSIIGQSTEALTLENVPVMQLNGFNSTATQLLQSERLVLQNKRRLLEETKDKMELDHRIASERVEKMRKAIGAHPMREAEREVFDLLFRLHELKLERADLDAQHTLSGVEVRRREYLLEQLHLGSCLSETIIRLQSDLLNHNKVQPPKELEHLLDLYEQQNKPLRQKRIGTSSSLTDFRLITPPRNHLVQEKFSISTSSIPAGATLEGSRYLRAASWLENDTSQTASYTESHATNGYRHKADSDVVANSDENGVHSFHTSSERSPSSLSRHNFDQGSLMSTDQKGLEKSTCQSQLQIPTISLPENSYEVRHLEHTDIGNRGTCTKEKKALELGLTTQSITKVAAQRRLENRCKENKFGNHPVRLNGGAQAAPNVSVLVNKREVSTDVSRLHEAAGTALATMHTKKNMTNQYNPKKTNGALRNGGDTAIMAKSASPINSRISRTTKETEETICGNDTRNETAIGMKRAVNKPLINGTTSSRRGITQSKNSLRIRKPETHEKAPHVFRNSETVARGVLVIQEK